MKQIKRIYTWVNVLVDRCMWCDGTGYSVYLNQTCSTCEGAGGKWRRERVLVGEVEIERRR